MGNNLEQRIVLGVKIIQRILCHKKWKWEIKHSEKSHCLVCRSNKSRFLKQKNKLTIDVTCLKILVASNV